LNGRGSCMFANGNRFEGEFRDGKRHGRGVAILANGIRIEGSWRNDKFEG
jgi:hypothetical protein